MKLLIESWRKFLTEVSAAEAKWFGPAFQAIADDPSVLAYPEWIEENIGPFLGAGYSRSAYAMKSHPNLVFKIADNMVDEGRYTNGEEKKMFNKYPEFFPRVWMTSEHMDLDPHIRSKTAARVDGRIRDKIPKPDNAYLDWIIVDRVKTFDRGELDEFLGKNFPIFDQVIEEMPWRKSSDGGVGVPPNIRVRLLTKFLYSLEVNIPTHRHGLGGIAPWLNRELSLTVVDRVVEKAWNMMIKDPKLIKISEIVTAADMRTDEIRSDNVGTDMATGTKLIFLDINKFLYKQGAMDP